MTAWVVRAGKHGGHAETCRKDGYITICWDLGGDPIDSLNKDQLSEKYIEVYPNASKRTTSEEVSQIYRFTHEVQKGDPVILPDPAKRIYYIGEISGPCHFVDADQDHPEGSYRRDVIWNTDVPFDAPLTETLRRTLDIANLTVYMVVDKVLNDLKNASQDDGNSSQDETPSDAGATETSSTGVAEEINEKSSEESK